jgi:hypothetical protein
MVALIVWLASMCLAGWIGRRKDMVSLGWVLGAVIGIIGVVIIACIPRRFAPVWQGWMLRLHGRGRIIAGGLLLLAWIFIPSISRGGTTIAQVHAECGPALASGAQALEPGIGVDCNAVNALYMYLTVAALAGLLLVLWGAWTAWGALLAGQSRKLSATARPAPPLPPRQSHPPAPPVPQPPAPACTCGSQHGPGDVFCGRCGRRVDWNVLRS